MSKRPFWEKWPWVAGISAAVACIGLLLMGLEIYGRSDPTRIQVYTYVTSVGLAGLFVAFLFKLRQREEEKKGK